MVLFTYLLTILHSTQCSICLLGGKSMARMQGTADAEGGVGRELCPFQKNIGF